MTTCVAAMISHKTTACAPMSPYSGFRNCGRTASVNRYALGFSRLVTIPWRNVSARERTRSHDGPANAARLRSNEKPIQAM